LSVAAEILALASALVAASGLRHVASQVMTNASLRERFKLPAEQNATASRILRDALERNLIKSVDPESGSRRYTEYHPFWA
jgi:ATP-dependent DNA helicase RecG